MQLLLFFFALCRLRLRCWPGPLLEFLLKAGLQVGGKFWSRLTGFRRRGAKERSHAIDIRLAGCQLRRWVGDTSCLELLDVLFELQIVFKSFLVFT